MTPNRNRPVQSGRTILGFFIAPLVGSFVFVVLFEGIHVITEPGLVAVVVFLTGLFAYGLTVLFALPIYGLMRACNKVTLVNVLMGSFLITAVPCFVYLFLGQGTTIWSQVGTEVYIQDGEITPAGVREYLRTTLVAGLSGLSGGFVFWAVRKIDPRASNCSIFRKTT